MTANFFAILFILEFIDKFGRDTHGHQLRGFIMSEDCDTSIAARKPLDVSLRKWNLRRLAILLVLFAVPHPASGTDLHEAVRQGDVAAVDTLLADHVDVNGTDFFVGPPLHLAIIEGHVAIAEALIAAGADLEAEGEIGGDRPIHTAARMDHPDMIRVLLVQGAEPEAKNTNGQTALIVAAVNDSRNVLKALLDQGVRLEGKDAFKGQTALLHASFSGRVEVVSLLLTHGADINARDDSEQATALHLAVGGGARHDLIELLVAEGADLTARDHAGTTPLQWANQYALPETSELLRSLGAQE